MVRRNRLSVSGGDMKPIAVGDLVQIVRQRKCCPEETRWGFTFIVESIQHSESWRCSHCGMTMQADTVAWGGGPKSGAALSRLKRIPPLEELESNDLCHPMKEPA